MALQNSDNTTAKSAWIEPQVLSLDVGETQNVSNRGSDGCRHLDCTRS